LSILYNAEAAGRKPKKSVEIRDCPKPKIISCLAAGDMSTNMDPTKD